MKFGTDPSRETLVFASWDPFDGYHTNKKHWNTVTLDGSIPRDFVAGSIDHSCALVVAPPCLKAGGQGERRRHRPGMARRVMRTKPGARNPRTRGDAAPGSGRRRSGGPKGCERPSSDRSRRDTGDLPLAAKKPAAPATAGEGGAGGGSPSRDRGMGSLPDPPERTARRRARGTCGLMVRQSPWKTPVRDRGEANRPPGRPGLTGARPTARHRQVADPE